MIRTTALIAALALAACTPQPAPNQPFGASVRMAVENQKVNPAPADDTPPTGLDGGYASGLMRTYQNPERFKSGKAGTGSAGASSSQGSSSQNSQPSQLGQTGQTGSSGGAGSSGPTSVITGQTSSNLK
jgi:hypothetical protein